ncbi:glycosyltransferase family 4 protein [Peribacillus asahii]|uniref:glycosyltransferase family 4 protein n=1 Tax=Peribacillus asahii TaxID=228899 RepID=UPI0037F561F4
MNQKKICIIGQFPPPIHGLSKALDTIVKSEYLDDKFLLHIINLTNNKLFIRNLNEIKKIDADIYYFTISQTKLGNIRDMVILNTLIKKRKKIIVHYHGGYYKSLYDSFSFFQKYVNQKLLNQINIMIVLSEGLKKLFSDVVQLDRIRVCENFVEDNSLIETPLFENKINNLKNNTKTLKVLYLSNFIESKGYLDVLNAAINLKTENVEFHFAGAFFKNDKEKQFMDYISKNSLNKTVVYHGVVKGEEKKQLLRQCDIFVLPTYYPKEGQPISIIEAMGNGLTIISSNHAGIPDIVTSENGYLVNPQSPRQISDYILILLNNRSKLIDFGVYNRFYTLKRFKEIDYIKRLENIFDEVLEYEN